MAFLHCWLIKTASRAWYNMIMQDIIGHWAIEPLSHLSHLSTQSSKTGCWRCQKQGRPSARRPGSRNKTRRPRPGPFDRCRFNGEASTWSIQTTENESAVTQPWQLTCASCAFLSISGPGNGHLMTSEIKISLKLGHWAPYICTYYIILHMASYYILHHCASDMN